jgi:multidrug efflux pump subunit AcrA (membrane-fusion protein)
MNNQIAFLLSSSVLDMSIAHHWGSRPFRAGIQRIHRSGRPRWTQGGVFLWICLYALFVSTLGLAAAQDAPPGPPPAPVTTVLAEGGAFSKPVNVTGTVEAFASTELSSEVDGYLSELSVDEGDAVTEGQVLAQIRPLPYRFALQHAEALLRADHERLRELQKGTREEDIAMAKANLAKAEVAAEIANKNYTRSRSLLEKKIISDEEFDGAHERWEEAQAILDVEKATYGRALAGAREEEIGAAEARAAASQAQVAGAMDRLERTTIRAPFDGVITAKHTEVGSWLAVGDGVFDLDTTNRVRVRVDIPETYYGQIVIGSEMSITFDGVPNKTFVGMVTKKIPRASGRSRVFPIKVELDNSDGRLASGMLARVMLETPHSGERSVIVPRDALVPRGPNHILVRVQDQDGQPIAEILPVKPGRYFGEAVEVFGDLRAGDRVVVRGNERLRPGQPLVLDRFLTN